MVQIEIGVLVMAAVTILLKSAAEGRGQAGDVRAREINSIPRSPISSRSFSISGMLMLYCMVQFHQLRCVKPNYCNINAHYTLHPHPQLPIHAEQGATRSLGLCPPRPHRAGGAAQLPSLCAQWLPPHCRLRRECSAGECGLNDQRLSTHALDFISLQQVLRARQAQGAQ